LQLNTIRGIVDINFRVFAANGRKLHIVPFHTADSWLITTISYRSPQTGEGTVYFKSERRHRAGRFETVHFRLEVDGRPDPIDLKNTDLLQLGN
jgi:hypothetical protein